MSDLQNYLTVTDDNFVPEVLNSSVPVVIDFWAAWCGPCRVMNPVISELASEFDGIAKVGKLNVDDYPNIASEYQIQGIPTLLIFQNGKVVERLVGVTSKSTLANKINALLEEAHVAAA